MILALALLIAGAVFMRRCESPSSVTRFRPTPRPSEVTAMPATEVPLASEVPTSLQVPPPKYSFEWSLWRMLARHRYSCSGMSGICYGGKPLQYGMQVSGRRELRLLALAFPVECLQTARSIIASTPRNRSDMEAALWLLTVLSDKGDVAASGDLATVGLGADREAAWMLVELLHGVSEIQRNRTARWGLLAAGLWPTLARRLISLADAPDAGRPGARAGSSGRDRRRTPQPAPGLGAQALRRQIRTALTFLRE